jgi:hypothetical protein
MSPQKTSKNYFLEIFAMKMWIQPKTPNFPIQIHTFSTSPPPHQIETK